MFENALIIILDLRVYSEKMNYTLFLLATLLKATPGRNYKKIKQRLSNNLTPSYCQKCPNKQAWKC